MALGADDEEAAGIEHLLAVLFDFLLDLVFAPAALLRIGNGREFGRHAHLEIAAELDVGAAAGHVGGDGHGARHAGLRDDLRFLLVIARIEHVVRRHWPFFSMPERSSDFSIEVVPTRTG